MSERRGPWRQVSRCRECGYIKGDEVKWMDGFFVPVCPSCGERNPPEYGWTKKGIFDAVTARRVTSRWGRFLRWEFKNELVGEDS